jgi:hypothetical protein
MASHPEIYDRIESGLFGLTEADVQELVAKTIMV